MSANASMLIITAEINSVACTKTSVKDRGNEICNTADAFAQEYFGCLVEWQACCSVQHHTSPTYQRQHGCDNHAQSQHSFNAKSIYLFVGVLLVGSNHS